MASSSLSDVNDRGAFARRPSVFRDKVCDLPAACFPVDTERYVLYVSYACPWACRCLAVHLLKGLEKAIQVVVVDPVWGRTRPEDDTDRHEGWLIPAGGDPVFGARSIRDVYDHATPTDMVATERFTVPILLDRKQKRIVNNESSEIMRMLNSAFNSLATHPEVDLVPAHLENAINETNALMYDAVNNGVYRCGFARTQEAYNEAVSDLFNCLDHFDGILATRRFLVDGSEAPTESDVRLFVTLVRFDEVYVVHFKTNKKTLREYPALRSWLRDVYQWAGGAIRPSVNMEHIKMHYYGSHRALNPYGIIPVGPGTMADLDLPHHRDGMPCFTPQLAH